MFYSKPQARTFSAQFSATPFSPPTGLLVKMEFYQSHKKDGMLLALIFASSSSIPILGSNPSTIVVQNIFKSASYFFAMGRVDCTPVN